MPPPKCDKICAHSDVSHANTTIESAISYVCDTIRNCHRSYVEIVYTRGVADAGDGIAIGSTWNNDHTSRASISRDGYGTVVGGEFELSLKRCWQCQRNDCCQQQDSAPSEGSSFH